MPGPAPFSLSVPPSTPDRRDATLLKATVDLFVQAPAHDAEELRRFEELVIQFLPKAGPEARGYVAQRLADRIDVPIVLLVMLGKDLIEVAEPVLARAPGFRTVDLLTVIAATGPMHQRVIARRASIDDRVRTALRLRGDAEVLTLLRAGDEPAAGPAAVTTVASDLPPPRAGSAEAFLAASSAERLAQIAALAARQAQPVAPPLLRQVEAALKAAWSQAELIASARRGDRTAMASTLADRLGLTADITERLMTEASGEPLIVLLRACGIDDSAARQMLLLANPSVGRNVESFFRLADLHASLAEPVAQAMVEAWRASREPPPPLHQPLHVDAERKPAPAARERPADRRASEATRRRERS